MSQKNRAPPLKSVLGQPSRRVASSTVEAFVTVAGGMVGPVTFGRGGQRIRPLSVAPWATEPLAPDVPPVLRALRGDFFCMPFGGNAKPHEGERHPAHGETANDDWRFQSLRRAGGTTELAPTLQTRVRPADVTETVRVVDGRDCGGVMSGEHGGGRGPLLGRFFGPERVAAFAEVKRLFDPAGILNAGNIVDAGPVASVAANLRANAGAPTGGRPHGSIPTIDTFYDYADQDGFDHAVEQCDGAGFCRKTAGGTVCASYRGTMDERHSTRGNALRLAICGQLRPAPGGGPDFADAETVATLDLCLSCKACKTECPSDSISFTETD